jgi:uncharacterized protein (TIGR00645 family)
MPFKFEHLHPKRVVELIVFNVRWLLIPFIGRIIYNFAVLAIHFFLDGHITPEDVISTIESLDVMMIACLVEMVITGSYNSSISKEHGYKSKNISSGTLKIKMGASLIGVSSVYLLTLFVAEDAKAISISQQDFWRKIIIHLAFIVGGYFLAIIDNILTKSESIEHQMEREEKQEINEIQSISHYSDSASHSTHTS